jgi:hypothetical protein
MLFAISGIVFLLFVTVSVATILDAQARIRHRSAEMNRASVSWNEAVTLGYGLIAPAEIESREAASFTSSLLAASGAHAEASRSSSQVEAALGALATDGEHL